VSATPLVDQKGAVTATLALLADITERKKAEEKVRLLSHAVDSSVDGVAMGNLEGKITYVNETFVEMFGYSREELIGKEIAFIYPKDQMPKHHRAQAGGGGAAEKRGSISRPVRGFTDFAVGGRFLRHQNAHRQPTN
jgi:PAS domain-containing protein